MATTKTTLIDQKIAELTKTIAALKTDESISKNTRGTQLYARGRERRVLHLIKTLVAAAGDDVKLVGDDMDTFVLITTLSSERKLTKYEFNEGDDLLTLMEKYPNLSRKDMETKLKKVGLKIDFETKKLVVDPEAAPEAEDAE